MAKLLNDDILTCLDHSYKIRDILNEHVEYLQAIGQDSEALAKLLIAQKILMDSRFAIDDYWTAARKMKIKDISPKTPIQHRADYVPPAEDLNGPVF